MADAFSSSDDVRTNQPLRYVKIARFDEPFELVGGGVLPEVQVAYETYGTLNDDRSNAVLVCHAISGDSHVAKHDEQDDPGWWDELIGPGLSVDTNRYFVICANVLGGCRGTTGPNVPKPGSVTEDLPEGEPYGPDFPAVTLQDIAKLHGKLLTQLGIERLHAAIGGSLGGHQVMTLATQEPHRVARCMAIATSPRLTAQSLAFDVVARNAILRDPHFAGGRYYDQEHKPKIGLAIARMLGHITYLSPKAMEEKFDPDRLRPRDVDTDFEKEFSVGSYLAYQGDKFTERFDANSYLLITKAMDLFDLGDTPAKLAQTLSRSTCDWTVVSFSSDWLFTPEQSRDIVDALTAAGRAVTYCEVPSDSGHDAFLLPDEISRFGKIIQARLETEDSPISVGDTQAAQEGLITCPDQGDARPRGPRSIFADDRLDYSTIVDLIDPGASVLDVGCGPGGLLAALKAQGYQDLQGVEVAEQDIIATSQRGLPVIDHDLNLGLAFFPDDRFDFVVLSQTLQAVVEVDRVIDEMLRVGQKIVVSFPNFAFKPLRDMLAQQGLSPKTTGRLGFEWHNTPNRRFPTILDFDQYCQRRGIDVVSSVYLDTQCHQSIQEDPNLNADTAIYVLTRS